ncbi:MAG: dihydrolipoyl dehydrogenase, partial [bacterium]
IEVNQSMQTNVKGIYAVGDLAATVGGHRDLAHAAAAEGAVAAEHALGRRARVSYDALPNCIFCEPQLASVGLTEAAARKKFRKIRVGRCPFLSVSKATLHGDRSGLVKIIGGPDGRLVGVHILGSSATELINIASAAIQSRAHLEDLARMSFVHPSLAESIHIAAEDALGRAIDLVPKG